MDMSELNGNEMNTDTRVGWHSNTHKRKMPKQSPMASPAKNEAQASSSGYVPETHLPLDAAIRSCVRQVVLKPRVRAAIVSDILRDLEPCLVGEFGRCLPYIFGSMLTGLALHGCDMDIYVDLGIGDNAGSAISDLKLLLQSVVQRCTRALRWNRRLFTNIVPIAQARVPIVKFVHSPTNISCDISFKDSLGVHNSRLLEYYLSLHPRIYEIMVVIKYWAKQHSICSFEFISSYGWTLLLIAYLQTLRFPNGDRFIPSVFELQKSYPINPMTTVNGWRVDFHPPCNHIYMPNAPQFTHLGLLEGFFKYYSNFRFDENIICPFLGQPVPWKALADDQAVQFPLDYQWFLGQMKEYFRDDIMAHSYVSIQDPLKHDFCISAVHGAGKRLDKIVACLETAVQLVACQSEQKRQDSESSTLLKDLFTIEPESSVGKFEIQLLKQLPGQREDDVVELAVSILDDVFLKIMKFEITSHLTVSTTSGEMSSKVSKTNEAENVHQSDNGVVFKKTYHCVATHPVWDFRKKLRKEVKLCFPETAFQFETKLSDEIVRRKYPSKRFKLSLTVSVSKRAVMTVSLEEGIETKSSNICTMVFHFLKNTLPSWMNIFLLEKRAELSKASASGQTKTS